MSTTMKSLLWGTVWHKQPRQCCIDHRVHSNRDWSCIVNGDHPGAACWRNTVILLLWVNHLQYPTIYKHMSNGVRIQVILLQWEWYSRLLRVKRCWDKKLCSSGPETVQFYPKAETLVMKWKAAFRYNKGGVASCTEALKNGSRAEPIIPLFSTVVAHHDRRNLSRCTLNNLLTSMYQNGQWDCKTAYSAPRNACWLQGSTHQASSSRSQCKTLQTCCRGAR